MNNFTRKDVLQKMIVLPALAAVAVAGTSAIAEAAKSPKAALQYQDTPKGGKQCSDCTLFIPGKTATANGTCKVVDGAISPKGWCAAFSPKA